ncbi:hypothetical protein PR048_028195 [Dryococelus australis]|uniref:Uncharacterized protein n=1 Tax=Dryococelus australis TaxID=614101 RepID=A0ABQ9GIL1_9NEOP|nr:hypothetical protein PR048_028195 [Dryococelus australis]
MEHIVIHCSSWQTARDSRIGWSEEFMEFTRDQSEQGLTEASMEQFRKERAGEMRDSRENRPISSIVSMISTCELLKECRSRTSEEYVQRTADAFPRSPRKSIRRASRELALPKSTVHDVLQKPHRPRSQSSTVRQGIASPVSKDDAYCISRKPPVDSSRGGTCHPSAPRDIEDLTVVTPSANCIGVTSFPTLIHSTRQDHRVSTHDSSHYPQGRGYTLQHRQSLIRRDTRPPAQPGPRPAPPQITSPRYQDAAPAAAATVQSGKPVAVCLPFHWTSLYFVPSRHAKHPALFSHSTHSRQVSQAHVMPLTSTWRAPVHEPDVRQCADEIRSYHL